MPGSQLTGCWHSKQTSCGTPVPDLALLPSTGLMRCTQAEIWRCICCKSKCCSHPCLWITYQVNYYFMGTNCFWLMSGHGLRSLQSLTVGLKRFSVSLKLFLEEFLMTHQRFCFWLAWGDLGYSFENGSKISHGLKVLIGCSGTCWCSQLSALAWPLKAAIHFLGSVHFNLIFGWFCTLERCAVLCLIT